MDVFLPPSTPCGSLVSFFKHQWQSLVSTCFFGRKFVTLRSDITSVMQSIEGQNLFDNHVIITTVRLQVTLRCLGKGFHEKDSHLDESDFYRDRRA